MRLILVALLLTLSSPGFAAMKYFAERKPACLQWHGEKGISQTPEVPSLGGMPEYYALLQLVAFRERNRKNEIMIGMVKDMTDDDLRAAAALVGSFPPVPAPVAAGDPARMKRGRELAAKNRCGICHGPKFAGGHQIPPLAHQREDYLLKALRDFKSEKRLGDRAAMVEVLAPLKDADLTDLAHYLAHVRLTQQ